MQFELNIENHPFLHDIYLKGEKTGKKTGEQRGIKIGESRLLQRQLELLFGKLPQWALRKLKTADSETLEQWGAKVIKAKKLEDVIPDSRRASPRAKR